MHNTNHSHHTHHTYTHHTPNMYQNEFSVVKCDECGDFYSHKGILKNCYSGCPNIIVTSGCMLHSDLVFVDRICYGGQTNDDPRPFSENYLPIFIGKASFFALVDSGATISTICTKQIQSIPIAYITKLPCHGRFIQGVTGTIEAIKGKYKIKFTADDHTYEGIFHEIASFNKILLGQDFLKRNSGLYDFENATLTLNGQLHRLQDSNTKSMLVKIRDLTTLEPYCIKDIWVTLARDIPPHESYQLETLMSFCKTYPDLRINEAIVNQKDTLCRIINKSNLPYIFKPDTPIAMARYVSRANYITLDEFDNLHRYYQRSFTDICRYEDNDHCADKYRLSSLHKRPRLSWEDIYCKRFAILFNNQYNAISTIPRDLYHQADMMDCIIHLLVKHHGIPDKNKRLLNVAINDNISHTDTSTHYCPCISQNDCLYWDLCRNTDNRPVVNDIRDVLKTCCFCVEHKRYVDINQLEDLISRHTPIRIYDEKDNYPFHIMQMSDDNINDTPDDWDEYNDNIMNDEDDYGSEEQDDNQQDEGEEQDKSHNKLIGFPLDIGDDDLPEEDKEKFRKFLEDYEGAFATKISEMGCLNDYQYQVKLLPDAKMVTARPYPVAPALQSLLDTELDELEKSGLIQESDSIFRSAMLVLKKKSLEPGKTRIRIVADFRDLNKASVPEYWPILRLQDIISFFAYEKPKYISSMDFYSSFWQIPVSQDSRKYLTVITPRRSVQYSRLPQGYLNSSIIFCKQIHRCLGSTCNRFHSMIYVDDLVTCSQTVDEMITYLTAIFLKCIKHGLTLNAKKSIFLKKKLLFVGHFFSKEGIEINGDKVKAVTSLKPPINVRGVRAFLGFSNFFRNFLANYSKIARPLHELTRKDVPFEWNEERNKAFETIKYMLTNPPALRYPIEGLHFHIACDASHHSIAYILYQKTPSKKEIAEGHPNPKTTALPGICQFSSRGLTDREKNYTIHLKEFLALLESVRAFHHFICHSHTIIHTDRTSLIAVAKQGGPRKISQSSSFISRGLLELENYSYSLCYIKTDDTPADYLSRVQNEISPPTHPKTKFQEIYDVDTLADMNDNEHDVSGGQISQSNQLTHFQAPQVPKESNFYEYCLVAEVIEEIPSEMKADLTTDEQISERENVFSLAQIDIVKLQQQCPETAPLYYFIKDDIIPPKSKIITPAIIAMRDQFQLKNEILFHLYQNRVKHGRQKGNELHHFTWRIVAPSNIRQQILVDNHDKMGHFSALKTFERVRMNFFWKNYWSNINDYVQSCLTCQQAKKYKPKPPKLRPLPIGDTYNLPNRRASLDIVGPICRTTAGHLYILSYIDHATNFTHFMPLKDTESLTIARSLHNNVLKLFGPPTSLLTDLGRNLIYSTLKYLSTLWQINRLRTASYKPSTNSQSEKSHLTLNRVLSKLCADHKNWDLFLPVAQFAINSAISARTGVSACFALAGFQPLTPIERELPIDISHNHSIPRDEIRFFLDSFHAAREIQHNYVIESQKASKSYFDLRAQDRDFHVGDICLIWDPVIRSHESKKLTMNWRGIFQIIYHNLEKTSFKLKDVNSERQTGMINIRRLIKCHLPANCKTRQQLQEAIRNQPISYIEDPDTNANDTNNNANNTRQNDQTTTNDTNDVTNDANDLPTLDTVPHKPRRNPERSCRNKKNQNTEKPSDKAIANLQKDTIKTVEKFHKNTPSNTTNDTNVAPQPKCKLLNENIIRITKIYTEGDETYFNIISQNPYQDKWYKRQELQPMTQEFIDEKMSS